MAIYIKCCETIFCEQLKCKSHWVLFIHSSDKLMFGTEVKHICLDFRLLDWIKLYEIFNQVFHILKVRCFVGLFLTERQYIVICLHNQRGQRKHWTHTKSRLISNWPLWTLVPCVICAKNMIQEFLNLCHTVHFQSRAISKTKTIPFILLIRRKTIYTFSF